MMETPRPGSSWMTIQMYQHYYDTKGALLRAIWYWTGVRPK